MTSRRLITRAAALSAAAVLVLAGCGDAEDEPIDPVDTTQAPPADNEGDDGADDGGSEESGTDAPAEDDGATDEPADQGTEDGSGDAGDAGDHAGVLAAIDLAEAETDGTAFEVDDADGGNWEIYIASGDDEVEVLVSSDGSEILANERDGSLDSEDRAGLDAATLTISEAIEIAAEHGTGSIDDVNLDDEDGGTFAWEVTFTDGVEVYINVDGGEVLRVETD